MEACARAAVPSASLAWRVDFSSVFLTFPHGVARDKHASSRWLALVLVSFCGTSMRKRDRDPVAGKRRD